LKDAKKCEEEWKTFSTQLAGRIELVQKQLAGKLVSDNLEEIVNGYKESVNL
jgi:hypothetical protein